MQNREKNETNNAKKLPAISVRDSSLGRILQISNVYLDSTISQNKSTDNGQINDKTNTRLKHNDTL